MVMNRIIREGIKPALIGTDETGKVPVEDVPLHKLEIEPALFQHRPVSDDHVEELQRLLKVYGDLEPVTIIRTGNRMVLVEGHHRRAGYWRSKRKTIPARCFGGTVEETVAKSFQDNGTVRNPITSAQRSNFAWRCVKLGICGTQLEYVRLTGVGERTIRSMYKALEILGSAALKEDSWFKAAQKAGLSRAGEFDEMAIVESMKSGLRKAFKPTWARQHEAMCKALLEVLGREAKPIVALMAKEVLSDEDEIEPADNSTEALATTP
jgi:hypothetical protein